MTPNKKAKELYDMYCYIIRTEETEDGYFTNIIHAKQCALVSVDEIINSYEPVNKQNGLNYSHDMLSINFINYWKEVKEEIELL
jgi:hypothetical protein